MKKIILCSFAVALAIGAYLLNSNETSEVSLFSANVEALTSNEGEPRPSMAEDMYFSAPYSGYDYFVTAGAIYKIAYVAVETYCIGSMPVIGMVVKSYSGEAERVA